MAAPKVNVVKDTTAALRDASLEGKKSQLHDAKVKNVDAQIAAEMRGAKNAANKNPLEAANEAVIENASLEELDAAMGDMQVEAQAYYQEHGIDYELENDTLAIEDQSR